MFLRFLYSKYQDQETRDAFAVEFDEDGIAPSSATAGTFADAEAIRAIRFMEDKGLDIELVEQPVIYHDIDGLKRVSKPGLRIYTNCEDMPKVMKGLGTAIISTSKGVMTDKAARAAHVGGEVLAFVW